MILISILVISLTYSYPVFLDSLTNKPIRIIPSEYPYSFLSEMNSYFGNNPFRIVGEHYTAEYSVRSQINRDGPLFKIKIGNSELCKSRKELVKCKGKADLWEITRHESRFLISKNGYCLSVGEDEKVHLERCNGFKENHLFTFKDAELETCLESIDLGSQPKTEAEMVEQLKLKKKLSQLGKKDKRAADKLKDKQDENNDFDKFMDSRVPKIKGKKDMKKVMKSLWNYGWRRPKLSWGNLGLPDWGFPFCTKLW